MAECEKLKKLKVWGEFLFKNQETIHQITESRSMKMLAFMRYVRLILGPVCLKMFKLRSFRYSAVLLLRFASFQL